MRPTFPPATLPQILEKRLFALRNPHVSSRSTPVFPNQAFATYDDMLNRIKANYRVDLRLTGGQSHPWDLLKRALNTPPGS